MMSLSNYINSNNTIDYPIKVISFQYALLAKNIQATESIEKCLNTDKDIKRILNQYIEKLKVLLNFYTKCQSQIMIRFIETCYLIYSYIITKLEAIDENGVYSMKAFSYLTMPKFFFQSQEKIYFEIMEHKIENGYEYCGSDVRLMFSPDLESAICSIMMNLKFNYNTCVFGEKSSGSMELIKSISYLCGYSLRVIENNINYYNLSLMFSMLNKTNNWVVFKYFDQFSDELMSTISKTIFSQNQRLFLFGVSRTPFKYSFLQLKLRQYYRNVNIIMPDKSVYFNYYLQSMFCPYITQLLASLTEFYDCLATYLLPASMQYFNIHSIFIFIKYSYKTYKLENVLDWKSLIGFSFYIHFANKLPSYEMKIYKHYSKIKGFEMNKEFTQINIGLLSLCSSTHLIVSGPVLSGKTHFIEQLIKILAKKRNFNYHHYFPFSYNEKTKIYEKGRDEEINIYHIDGYIDVLNINEKYCYYIYETCSLENCNPRDIIDTRILLKENSVNFEILLNNTVKDLKIENPMYIVYIKSICIIIYDKLQNFLSNDDISMWYSGLQFVYTLIKQSHLHYVEYFKKAVHLERKQNLKVFKNKKITVCIDTLVNSKEHKRYSFALMQLLNTRKSMEHSTTPDEFNRFLCGCCLFGLMWGISGSIDELDRENFFTEFQSIVNSKEMEKYCFDVPKERIKNYYFKSSWILWDEVKLEDFVLKEKQQICFVYPSQSLKQAIYFIDLLRNEKINLIVYGKNQTFKTTAVLSSYKNNPEITTKNSCLTKIVYDSMSRKPFYEIYANFFRKTQTENTSPLAIFIDDYNLPNPLTSKDRFIINHMIEYIDNKTWYELNNTPPALIDKIKFILSVNTNHGSLNKIPARLTYKFLKIQMESSSEDQLYSIFDVQVKNYFNFIFAPQVISYSILLVEITRYCITKFQDNFSPSYFNSLYPHSWKSLNKFFFRFFETSPIIIKTHYDLLHFWIHEIYRNFVDKIFSENDSLIDEILRESITHFFPEILRYDLPTDFNELFFSDIEALGVSSTLYMIVDDVYTEEFTKKVETCKNPLSLQDKEYLFYDDLYMNLLKIKRLFYRKFSSLILFGLPGSLKKMHCKIVAHLMSFNFFSFDLYPIDKTINRTVWCEFIIKIFEYIESSGKEAILYLPDTVLDSDEIMVDINNLTTPGCDISYLYKHEIYNSLLSHYTNEFMRKSEESDFGIGMHAKDSFKQHFIFQNLYETFKSKLHIVIGTRHLNNLKDVLTKYTFISNFDLIFISNFSTQSYLFVTSIIFKEANSIFTNHFKGKNEALGSTLIANTLLDIYYLFRDKRCEKMTEYEKLQDNSYSLQFFIKFILTFIEYFTCFSYYRNLEYKESCLGLSNLNHFNQELEKLEKV